MFQFNLTLLPFNSVFSRSVERDEITRFLLQDSVTNLLPPGTPTCDVDNTDCKLFSGAVNTDGQPCVRNICANLKKMALSEAD